MKVLAAALAANIPDLDTSSVAAEDYVFHIKQVATAFAISSPLAISATAQTPKQHTEQQE